MHEPGLSAAFAQLAGAMLSTSRGALWALLHSTNKLSEIHNCHHICKDMSRRRHLHLCLQGTAIQDTGAVSACSNHAALQPCLAAVMRPQTGVPPALAAPAHDRS